MNNLELIGCQLYKKGSGIHIKKKNRGKFTAAAKKAGQSVQEHARAVLNNPNATPLQKKRANFARNAAKWKHEDGAKIHKPDGHRSILDNGWISTKRLKKGTYGLIKKHQKGGKANWELLKKDPEYIQNFNWKMIPKNLSIIEDSLTNRKASRPQKIAAFAQIIPESGGSTSPHGNGAFGLIGWRGVRTENLPKNLSGQTHTLMEGLFNNKAEHWTHGGPGTNVNTGKEMQKLYQTSPNIIQATKAIMKGYVRPDKSEWDKRIKFANLLKKYIK